MTNEQKQEIRKWAELYKDLGLLDASGDTAVEMVKNIETGIRNQEKRLVGDVNTERQDIEARLAEIAKERAEIKSELESIDAEIAQLEGKTAIKDKGLN
jgi:chromosome segregation ATPase